MVLKDLYNVIRIPDFAGLPNLETFELYGCTCLEEIHSSIGCLESLVFLSIYDSPRLRMFPSIIRIKKLDTLKFTGCEKLEIISEIQQDMDKSGKEVASCCSPPGVECCLPHYNLNHRQLQFSHSALRELVLCKCSLGDEEIGSDVWELPNLEQLDLSGNLFSRLDFSILRLPQLKWLDVSLCKGLVELSELPSSIAVVHADCCCSLESFGDISNYKWLWNVILWGKNKLGQHHGDRLIHSMFQGNASEDHFISVVLQHQFPRRFVGGLFSRGKTFRLHLPDDRYNDFCGFLICIVSKVKYPHIKIIMKQEDPPFDLLQACDEAVEPIYHDRNKTCVGYVSFSSLRHTTFFSSSYNIISLTIEDTDESDDETDDGESTYVGIELISRKSKSDEVQTTDCSQFWDGESNTFKIKQCDSKSPIEISWRP